MRHGFDHPQHRRDDAQSRQPIRHVLQRMRAVQRFFQGFFQLPRHHILDLVRIIGVHAHHAQIVANHVDGGFIAENFRKILKGRTFGGVLDMRFQRHRAFGRGEFDEIKQQR